MLTEKRVAFVTRAAQGIGRAIALRLARDGHWVMATAEVDPDETITAIRAGGGQADGLRADFRDPGSGAAAVDWALAATGRLDALVNVAGITASLPADGTAGSTFDELVAVNLRSQWETVGRAADALAGASGSVVNVSSVHAAETLPGCGVYAATKGAIEAMTRGLALDVGPRGVRVNAVAPGLIEVDRIRSDPGYDVAEMGAQIPLGRVGVPDEVASVVSFLLGADARYVNGAVITVDGGLTTRLPLTWGNP